MRQPFFVRPYDALKPGPLEMNRIVVLRNIPETNRLKVLQEHVYFRNLADETPDILAELLQLEGALPRYNPRILEQPSALDRYALLNSTFGVPRLEHVSTGALLSDTSISDAQCTVLQTPFGSAWRDRHLMC